MATNAYTLYARQGSGSFAIEVALEELGIAYQRDWISKESPDVDRLRAIYSSGKVPVLKLPDGTLMVESAAMLLYLTATKPGSGLAPAPGSLEYAQFVQWIVFLSANVYEALLRIYYASRYSARGAADAAAIAEQATVDVESHLQLLNQVLRPYVLGATYSVADPYLYMLTSWYPGDKSALFARLPALAGHTALVGARPAIKKIEAEHT